MEITFSEDILDSRSIQERYDELDAELEELQDELENNLKAYVDKQQELKDEEDEDRIEELLDEVKYLEEDVNGSRANLADWKVDNDEEYELLKECIDKFGDYGDWIHGETLIHEDYWVEYVEDLCKELGEIPDNLPWYIADCIDWEAVADNIAQDYMTEEINGYNYYMRNC